MSEPFTISAQKISPAGCLVPAANESVTIYTHPSNNLVTTYDDSENTNPMTVRTTNELGVAFGWVPTAGIYRIVVGSVSQFISIGGAGLEVFVSDEIGYYPSVPVNMIVRTGHNVEKTRQIAYGPAVFGESNQGTLYTATKEGDEILLNGSFFVKVENIVGLEFDLSFDHNGYPIIVYQNDLGVSAYYRYDSIYSHRVIDYGAETPYIDLNIKSESEFSDSRNIIVYRKGTGVACCSTGDLFSAKVGLISGAEAIQNAGLSDSIESRLVLEVSGNAETAIFGNAAISSLTFDDNTDVAGFTASHPGKIFWATTPTGVTPTQEEMRLGNPPVLESGHFSAVQSNSFTDNYTGASGAHLQVRQLNFFVDPFDAFTKESPVVTTSIELFLTPLKFMPDYWDLENEGDGTTILLDIMVLPHDNGDPITSIEYNLNGTGWTNLGGTSRGTYEITGVNGVLQTFKIRSSNSNGPSFESTEKSVIPQVTTHDEFIFSEWQADENVTGINGSAISDGADVYDWLGVAYPNQTQMNFGVTASKPVYRATGTPNGGPYIEFVSGNAMEASMDTGDFPVGNEDRTLAIVIRVPQYQPSYPGAPIYGLPANNQAFGLSFNPDYKPLFDYWGAQVIGNTVFDDYVFRTVFISHRKSVSRVFVNNVLEAEQIDVVLNTQIGKVYLGRVDNVSRSGFEIAAIMMYDHGLSNTHRTQVQNYLSSKYLV